MRSLLVLVLLAFAATPVMAQDNWLVTEVRAGDASGNSSQTATRVAEILRSRGVPVIDNRSAASEIEHKHSRTPVRLQPEELERLDGALRTLADHLASENLPEARAALEKVERLTPDARDYLNRQVNRARRRFHTCLLAAHLFAKEGYDDDAFNQVRKCARDFPGFEPEEGEYMPDSIKSFFSRAREELQSIRPATIHVDVAPGSASSCRVRINGIDKGAVPARIADVRTEAVRAQLECDGRSGRIYNVPVRPGDNRLTLDPRLDRALDTSSALVLHYPDTREARQLRVEHGLAIARAVGASHMLEVFGGRLTRLDVASKSQVGEVDLTEVSLDSAVDTLIDARGGGSANVNTDIEPYREADAGSGRPSVLAPLAWISAGAAVLAGATTFVGWRVREAAAEDFNQETCLDAEDPNRPTRATKCADSLSTVQTGEAVMVAAGISAGVFAGLATLFFVLDSSSGESAERAALRSPCGSGPGEIGVACRVQF
jgi:hypothetical protein